LFLKASERLPDPTVAVEEEIFGCQEMGNIIIEDRAQDGLFCLAIVRHLLWCTAITG
jgi:hypothetical protein